MKLKRSIFAPILGLVIFTDSHANVPADIIPSDSLRNGTQFLKEVTVTGKKVQIIERGMDYTRDIQLKLSDGHVMIGRGFSKWI